MHPLLAMTVSWRPVRAHPAGRGFTLTFFPSPSREGPHASSASLRASPQASPPPPSRPGHRCDFTGSWGLLSMPGPQVPGLAGHCRLDLAQSTFEMFKTEFFLLSHENQHT